MKRMKALIVDDDIDFLTFVETVIQTADVDCIALSDSSQFSQVYSHDIDVIILDLFMPNADGIELIRMLGEWRSRARLIFMSGKDVGVLHAAEKLAVEKSLFVIGALQKPFKVAELLALVSSVELKIGDISPPNSSTTNDFVPSLIDIENAIQKHQFHLVYQPQVNLGTGALVGAEVLLRWQHPEHGFVPPSVFIPIAEKLGVINSITEFVNQTAICQLGVWNRQGLKLRLSLNMSAVTLNDLDLPEKISELAASHQVDCSQLVLEVTETGLMEDVSRSIDILTRLRMKSFQLSIDDFGTGYSSLLQLVRIPFNELKIDLSFVKNYFISPEYKAVAETAVILAHQLKMTAVAEGIEDQETYDALKMVWCDEGQGYHIAKPMLAPDFERWVQEHNTES